MPLHYTKSGALDMRYSSSKAAAASSNYSTGASYSSGRSSYSPTPTSSSSQLHYKKDGSLDMRYSSSQASVSQSSYSPSASELHYKKDGSLDMRYSSSKASSVASNNSRGEIQLKKDGTPDMRYKSSKELVQGLERMDLSSSALHHKKDGSLDMRYSSSKSALGIAPVRGVPTSIPLTKSGLPDMRTKAGKEWAAQQFYGGCTPTWLPRKKDGSLDTSKAVVAEFLKQSDGNRPITYDQNLREDYYKTKLCDDAFRKLVERTQRQPVEYEMPYQLPNTEELRKHLVSSRVLEQTGNLSEQLKLPTNVQQLDYAKIKQSFPEDEEKAIIGRGAFGVVLKGMWAGHEVAVKRLHLTELTKKERPAFLTELQILAHLGEHPNLVKLYGYTLKPLSLVMEFVKLGSLNYLIHYSEDHEVEAKMTFGKIKKRLVVGIVNGMLQLHAVNVVHGDLKPHNILVTEDYTAKITDFGLATLRGKTSSTVASNAMDDGERVIGGTGGYMAPELLDSSEPPQLLSDVYSFGVLMNEVIQEEEPFTGQERNWHGRGNFGAANYAKLGNRPIIHSSKTPGNLKALIEKCWDRIPHHRPTFKKISEELASTTMAFPNSFNEHLP